jgi:hypothetical protein
MYMLVKENGYFPFLEISKTNFQNTIPNFNIENVDENLIELSKTRLLQSLKYKRITLPNYIKDKPNDVDNDIVRDIKCYIITRILASLVKRKIDNYIEAESFRAIELAQRDKLIDYLMNELGIEIDKDFTMSLSKYLTYSSTFTHMKLSNREVSKGRVKLNDYEINVILREAVKIKLKENFPIRLNLINDSVKERLKPYLEDITSQVQISLPYSGRQSTDIAPCMEAVIGELESGNKVNHLKNWSLAVFLIKRGWDDEKIILIYSKLPNFNEKLVQYQLDHIRDKNYSMPSCSNLKTQGICVTDCKIKNPLMYRKKK